MKFIRPINGGLNIPQKTGSVKQNDALAKPLGMFGFGFNKTVQTSTPSVTVKPQTVIPQTLIDKFSTVDVPKGKPTQLTIDDKYYIPDKDFADAEV